MHLSPASLPDFGTVSRKHRLLPFLGGVLLAVGAPAFVSADSPPDDEPAVLEPIVVTAQRREQSLQDVPVTVTAFTGEFVQENGIVDIRGLQGLTPNLSIKSNGEREAAVFIRGIGSIAPGIGADPAVGIFIDGVTASRGENATAAFFDVERIEVIKGPQGTLFGRNASAGVISITTNKPRLESTFGHAMGGVGDEGQLRGQFVANWALSDAWALRLGGNHVSRDGLIDNELTGRDLLDINSNQLRAQLLGRPGNAWETTLLFEAIDAENNDAIFTNADAFSPTTRQNEAPRKEELESTRLIWTNTWDLGGRLELTSITGYYDHDVSIIPVDADATEIPAITFVAPSAETFFSQELRLNGSTDSTDWFVGASYFGQELSFDTDLRYDEVILLDLLGLGALCASPDVPPCGIQSEIPFGSIDVDSVAVYGDLIWSFSESARLTFGARYTRDEKAMDYANPRTAGVLGALDAQIFGPVTDGLVPASDAWSSFDPRIALDWDLTERTTLFANLSKGYKSGGINRQVDAFLPDPQNLVIFDEETVLAFEIGSKSRFLGGRASLNASVFYSDYQDFQLETLANLLPAIFNVGDVEGYGLELEGRWLATDSLELAATYAYLESEVVDSEFEPELVDNATPQSPQHSASAQAAWTLPGDVGEWRFSGTWTYTDDFWFDIFNTLEQSALHLFDLRAGLTASSGRWQIAAFVNNLTDEEYFTERFVFLDVANRRAPGRLYRAEATWYF